MADMHCATIRIKVTADVDRINEDEFELLDKLYVLWKMIEQSTKIAADVFPEFEVELDADSRLTATIDLRRD